MTLNPPSFFFPIRDEARETWDDLEAKPKIAGPWHQLFMQVKSPQHVLSELLQNADDAGATWADASIVEGTFRFVHDGEDFNAQTFSSLCNFAYSNKRTLHTIGFRGIGFKSVFSLGPEVHVTTPTMNFSFHESRFTEPVWEEGCGSSSETIIKVKMKGPAKQKAIENDFKRWQQNSISLLFFNHIKRLSIQNEQILREDLEEGPVSCSRWIKLNDRQVLLISSHHEQFPPECIEEIKKERGMENIKDDLPPCSVQIVLEPGSQSFLYTVLPTEVKPLTPFSFNAPFLTDPARIKIKDLSDSQTNKWLLKRIGQLAADTLTEWIGNTSLDLKDRARAYALLPEQIKKDGSIEKDCSSHIIDAMKEVFESKSSYVLCNDGTITSKNKAIALPGPVLDTWGDSVALHTFAPEKTKIVARMIDAKSKRIMESWGFIESKLGNVFVSDFYRNKIQPPCPQHIERLTFFWSFLRSHINDYPMSYYAADLPIMPVAKKDKLLSANAVVSAGNINTRLTEEEWSFLMQFADLIDPRWINILSSAPKIKDRLDTKPLDNEQKHIHNSARLYEMLALKSPVGLDHVMHNVASNIFMRENPGPDGITIAHIAAKGSLRVDEEFRYLCRDGVWRKVDVMLIAPEIGHLDDLFPSSWLLEHVLSEEYCNKFPGQDISIWRSWVRNQEKSRVYCFPIPQKQEASIEGIQKVEHEIMLRGGSPPDRYLYSGENFILHDYDWEAVIWDHWNAQAQLKPEFWLDVGREIIFWYNEKWHICATAKVKQKAKKHSYAMEHGELCSSWLLKIRALRCLSDIYGSPATPAELMYTTPDTAPLSSVERFIHKDLDKQEYAEVLELLGVRGEPKGIGPLLDRLQAISRAEKPPITDLGKLYECIERALVRMSPEEAIEARDRFMHFRLVYTEDGAWEYSHHVYLDNPEQIPGVNIIHHEFLNMKLWERLNVTPRPTFEMVLGCVLEIPVGHKLSEEEKKRVRGIIRRDPQAVWSRSDAWLDLSGRWQDKKSLRWGMTRNPAPALFDSFRQKTADFSMVQSDLAAFHEYTGLSPLEEIMEERMIDVENDTATPDAQWLVVLGSVLMRLKDPGTRSAPQENTSPYINDRALAARMKVCVLKQVKRMKVAPYIHSEQAGSERDCAVVWIDDVLYVKGTPAQHIHELKKTLVSCFSVPSARAAIEDCVYRDPSWIHDYALHNLDLMEDELPDEPDEKVSEFFQHTVSEQVIQEDEVKLSPGEEAPNRDEPSHDGNQNDNKVEKRPSHPRKDHLGDAFRVIMDDKGYSLDGKRYVHPNGNRVTETEQGSSFDWIEFDNNGQIISLYWVGRGSMREGFDIPSEVWNYQVQDNMEVYLILIEKEIRVQRYTLSVLKHMAETGQVEVFPHALKVRMVC